MRKLVLLRHGQSVWNLENRFTGWKDIDLSDQGMVEAHNAGKLLKAEGYQFDVAYTSLLKRAIRTLWIVLDKMDENLNTIKHYYLGDEKEIRKATKTVTGQISIN